MPCDTRPATNRVERSPSTNTVRILPTLQKCNNKVDSHYIFRPGLPTYPFSHKPMHCDGVYLQWMAQIIFIGRVRESPGKRQSQDVGWQESRDGNNGDGNRTTERLRGQSINWRNVTLPRRRGVVAVMQGGGTRTQSASWYLKGAWRTTPTIIWNRVGGQHSVKPLINPCYRCLLDRERERGRND